MATTTSLREERIRLLLELNGYGNIEDTAAGAVERLNAWLSKNTGGAHYDWVQMLARNIAWALLNGKPVSADIMIDLRGAAKDAWYRGDDDEQQILNDLHLALIAEGACE